MAEITNPEAVAFCNDKLRILADTLYTAYLTAKRISEEWYANNLGSILPVADDVVIDGAAQDGRHTMTSNKANLLITRCDELVADMEANSNAKLNTILTVQVNGSSRV